MSAKKCLALGMPRNTGEGCKYGMVIWEEGFVNFICLQKSGGIQIFCVPICVCMCVCVHIHSLSHTHTYMYIYTHMCVCTLCILTHLFSPENYSF